MKYRIVSNILLKDAVHELPLTTPPLTINRWADEIREALMQEDAVRMVGLFIDDGRMVTPVETDVHIGVDLDEVPQINGEYDFDVIHATVLAVAATHNRLSFSA